jgi:hypothetical protein
MLVLLQEERSSWGRYCIYKGLSFLDTNKLIINACIGMSATRNESALRTDFELAQQVCSDQSGVGQQADHPEQDEEPVVELNKCRLEQLSLSPMSVELARK